VTSKSEIQRARVSDLFKTARKMQDRDQTQSAVAMGCTQGTVSKIENKLMCASFELIMSFCDAYGVSIVDFKDYLQGNIKHIPIPGAKVFLAAEKVKTIKREKALQEKLNKKAVIDLKRLQRKQLLEILKAEKQEKLKLKRKVA
jgi:transcriptional regulator with XRE-family HTH domain